MNFIQNHDQVANSARGLRAHLLTSPGRYRAMTALLLLSPGTPMLFQGQEFAASAPFLYFADHNPELAELVRAGRQEFLTQFPSIADPKMRAKLNSPHAWETFANCKLNLAERQSHDSQYRLTKDLLRLRRNDLAFSAQASQGVDGAVLGKHAFVLRFLADGANNRLLIVNLGHELQLVSCPEPLLAPPIECRWVTMFSTEDPQYGGNGTGPVESEDDGWRIPPEAAVVLAPERDEELGSWPLHGRPGRKGRIVY